MSFRNKAKEQAARVKSLGVATARANAAQVQATVDAMVDHYVDGMSIEDVLQSAKQELTDAAIAKYRPKLVAAFKRAGIEIGEDDAIDVDTISRIVAERAGLGTDHVEMTVDGVLDALDGLVAAKLSEELKIEIDSIRDIDNLKAIIDAEIKKALRDGTAERLMTKGAKLAMRKIATWKRHGIPDKAMQERLAHRVAQKRYARTHRQVWS